MARMSRVKQSVAIGAALLLSGGLATGITQVAAAQPQPTVSQVEAKVNADTSKFDQANQRYDQAEQQLSQAKAKLSQVNKEVAADQKQYNASRKRVVAIANASYEDSGQTSVANLLTSGNPDQVLNQASMILEIAGQRNMQAKRFLTQAQNLASVQRERQRTEQGIAQIASQRQKEKNDAQKALDDAKAQLNTLNAQQQATVKANTLGGSSSSSSGSLSQTITTVTGSGNARQAVAYAEAQLGCMYVYGATGPCSAGFDCSGLMMAAWASAGVTIPRDTYGEWSSLPHVSMSSIQPGDLILFDGEGHVGMYIGSNTIIDAPQTGSPVQRHSLSDSWYASTLDGAVRP